MRNGWLGCSAKNEHLRSPQFWGQHHGPNRIILSASIRHCINSYTVIRFLYGGGRAGAQAGTHEIQQCCFAIQHPYAGDEMVQIWVIHSAPLPGRLLNHGDDHHN